MQKEHLTKECYLAFINAYGYAKMGELDDLIVSDGDEICEQLWAEIKIMRTLKVRDLK